MAFRPHQLENKFAKEIIFIRIVNLYVNHITIIVRVFSMQTSNNEILFHFAYLSAVKIDMILHWILSDR